MPECAEIQDPKPPEVAVPEKLKMPKKWWEAAAMRMIINKTARNIKDLPPFSLPPAALPDTPKIEATYSLRY